MIAKKPIFDTTVLLFENGTCKDGFGPAHCTRVMCDDGNKLLDCHFVQEWFKLRLQESLFRLFWECCIQ